MADSRTEKEICKMSTEQLIVPQSKKIFFFKEKKMDRGKSKEYRSSPDKGPNGQTWNNFNNKIKNLTFG